MSAHTIDEIDADTWHRYPTKDEIKAARLDACMTQKGAADEVYVTEQTWQRWEYGDRKMHPAFFHLFRIKVASRVCPSCDPTVGFVCGNCGEPE